MAVIDPPETRPAREDDALPPLPELDDDGTAFGDDGDDLAPDLALGHEHEDDALDDATAERDPIEAWEVEGTGGDHESGLLHDTEASEDDVDVGAHDEGLVGEEKDLLEGSDEPDGRDVTADEAGIFETSEGSPDDGGAEGTGEDPALSLDDESALPNLVVETADDYGVEDESALEDGGQAGLRASLEREPWPTRADVAWHVQHVALASVDRAAHRSIPPPADVALPTTMREGGIVATDGSFVAIARYGEPLAVSLDRGARYVRLASCTFATAVAALPGQPGGRVFVASLYDVVRDVSALVVIRVADGTFVVELVADLVPTARDVDPEVDLDEQARIESLSVRLLEGGVVEVIARGHTFALSARG